VVAPSNPINAKEYSASSPGTTWTPDSAYAVGTESNRLFLVWVEIENTPNTSVTTVDFNTSESFTKILDVNEGLNHGSLWGLVNPSNATAAIDILIAADPTSITAIVWYHSNAEQVVPSEGEASNSNAGLTEISISVDITTSGSDRMIVAGGGVGDPFAMAAGTGETLIHEISVGSMDGAASYFMLASSGTRAMDFTFSAARRPNIVGVAIRPAAAIALTMAPYTPT